MSAVDLRSPRRAAFDAFRALVARDLKVLRKTVRGVALRVLLQPLLLVFTFTYVFPRIGQGIGGGAAAAATFSTLLIPGALATTIMFQGVQTVAIPMVSELGYTREIEDRVMAPLPVWAVGAAKLTSGAIQAGLGAAVVFPLAAVVPATPIHLDVDFHLLPVLVLSTMLAGSFGLTLGTRVAPQQVSLMFGIIIVPLIFLGAVYYPWQSLAAIPWLQWLTLLNPLVYVSEALRLALTEQIPTMPAPWLYVALTGNLAVFGYLGVTGFTKRVLT